MDVDKKKKLVHGFGLNPGVATKLVQAGCNNPGCIRRATDQELLALPGIKQTDIDDIREKVG